jgi:hypothetical protein
MNTRVWPKDKLLPHPPELPIDERIRRYQHNLITIREAGFQPFSAQVDSLDADVIRAWFEAGERRVQALKTAIRFVASLPVDEEGYALLPDMMAGPEEVAPMPEAVEVAKRQLLGIPNKTKTPDPFTPEARLALVAEVIALMRRHYGKAPESGAEDLATALVALVGVPAARSLLGVD